MIPWQKIRVLFFTGFFALFSFVALAQVESGFLKIKGSTQYNNKGVPGFKVTVKRGNSRFANSESGKRGKFEIKLEYHYQYTVTFEHPDYETVFFTVNTNIQHKYLPIWSTYYIDVPQYKKEDKEIDKSKLLKPFTRVVFDEGSKRFVDDLNYTEAFIDSLLGIESSSFEKASTIGKEVKTEPKLEVKNEVSHPIMREDEQKKEAMENKKQRDLEQKEMIKESYRTDIKKEEPLLNNNFQDKIATEEQKEKARKESAKNKSLYSKSESDLIKAQENKDVAAPLKKTKKYKKGTVEITETTLIYPDKIVKLLKEKSKGVAEKYFVNDKQVDKKEFEKYLKD